MDYRIITIGCLSHNDMWEEKVPERPAHATTTLIRSDDRLIIVDPGLPAQVIGKRVKERSGVDASKITDVFMTNFRPAHRRGLGAFPNAKWWISEMEREAVGQHLVHMLQQTDEDEVKKMCEQDVAILKRCEPAPDRLAAQVDLFPLPGYTPGNCGLLLLHMNSTHLIAGDAVPTVEHMEKGKMLPNGFDTESAKESFIEAMEIADVIIPGHDNLLLNPTRRPI